MGAWGPGLWESDGALDRVADLVPSVQTSKTAEDLAARVGLALWLTPSAVGPLIEDGELSDLLQRFDLAALPAPVRARLRTLAKGTAMDVPYEPRDPELAAALGEERGGVREPLLLETPHARRLRHELGENAAAALDGVEPSSLSRSFEEFAPLGLLVLLERRVDHKRAVGWRITLDRCDALTTGERAFWDDAVARVRPLFHAVSGPEPTDG